MFKKSFLFVFFLLSLVLYSAPAFKTSTSAFLYGPGFAATTENISSMNINPAGLYRILYTEAIINFDASYSFNYIGMGHFFKNFGNVGVSFFNNQEEHNKIFSLGYGAKVWKFFIFGFNMQYIHNTEIHEMSFNPGLLLYFKLKKTLKQLSFGFATENWLNRESSAAYNLAMSMTFKKRYGRTFIYTLGSSFDEAFQFSDYSFNTEFELFRYFFVNLGLHNNAIVLGNSLKKKQDALYGGIKVNYKEQTLEGMISYRRLIGKPYKPLRRKIKKSKYTKRRSKKTVKEKKASYKSHFEATAEEKIEQRNYLEKGIALYSKDRLSDALKEWKHVLDINDANEYAEQARVYINLVKNELNSIKRK